MRVNAIAQMLWRVLESEGIITTRWEWPIEDGFMAARYYSTTRLRYVASDLAHTNNDFLKVVEQELFERQCLDSKRLKLPNRRQRKT